MKKIKIAIAGYGKGAKIYNAPIISSVEGFEISRILTSSPENIAAAKEDFPNAKITSKFAEILEDPKIELILITTPNHLHKTHTEKALRAGKHVIVEKPITPTSEETEHLIALAKDKNLILTVNHNRRFDSDFQTVKKLLEEKKLGKIVQYEAHFYRFRDEVNNHWKEDKNNPGSGILYDLGSHLIDQALQLFGTPKAVLADIRIQRKGAEVPDYFELWLYYTNLKVSLNAGMLVKEKGPTFSIHGTKGSFVKFGDDPQEELLKVGIKPKDQWGWGIEPNEIWGKFNTIEHAATVESEQGDYRKFYENVYQVISGNEELLVKPEEARDVIKVIELAMQSNSEKRQVKFQ